MIINKIMKKVVAIAAFSFLFSFGYAQSCNYHLSMFDSYGDGWNGGSLEVLVNDTSIGVYSALNYGNSISFSVDSGDTIKLIYSSGAYENENTYKLFDASWNSMFQDGPNPATGLVYTGNANCNSAVLLGGHPCNAIPVAVGQCLFSSNVNFPQSGLGLNCTYNPGSEIWFSTIVPPSGNLTIETDSGTIFDSSVGVWVGDSCDNLHIIACDDDAGTGYYSYLILENLTPGQQLYIQVTGYGGAQGTFNICVNDINLLIQSSDLPLVLINTNGQSIVANNKIDCTMEIKYAGAGNITYLTDSSNIYSGNIGIEVRGATSSGYPQRPYNLETRDSLGNNNDVSLLGMPAENDWVLLSHYGDRSLLRNLLPYQLFGEMGNYSVKMRLCEVMVDSSYRGIYLLGEKIKRDNNRVNIAKLNPIDTIGDELTGGYILEQNIWDPSNSFQSNYSPIDHPGMDVHFLYNYPDATAIMPQQKAYIASYVDSLETALYSPNFTDTATGYRHYMDVKSFIDYFLMNEVARNADGFKKSIYYHKDKDSNGGKLKAGPVWDFDWAWKNIYGCFIFENLDGSGWAYQLNDCQGQDVNSTGWFVRLLQDSSFRDELHCTYESYRQTILDTAHIFGIIDSVAILVQNAQSRHFALWHVLGEASVAPEINNIGVTYAGELDSLKKWIVDRIDWLDANMPGLCTTTAINEISAVYQLIKSYPNPTHDLLQLDIANILLGEQFEVYDYTGKLIYRREILSEKMTINTNDWSAGVYLIKAGNKNQQSIRVVKE